MGGPPREAVVDASAVVDWLTDSASAERALTSLGYDYLSTPAHMDAEVLSALRGKEMAAELTEGEAAEAAVLLAESPIQRFPLEPLVEEAWTLRHNMTAYDALYVTLARRLDCAIVTADRRWAGVPGVGVPMIFVSA